MFVTFEGVEGSGKSSRARALVLSLRRSGERVLHTREPGGPPVSERIRELLLEQGRGEIPPLTELFLYLASRSANVALRVAPAIRAGTTVVCERYSDATLAYQVGGRGLPREPVERADRLATGGLVPDLTVLLDLDPRTGLDRLRLSGRDRDRIEMEDMDFHRRTRDMYLRLAREESGRYLVMDAEKPETEQDHVILQVVRSLLADRPDGERKRST